MLQTGLYCSEHQSDNYLDNYRVVIHLKETATAFHLTLVDGQFRYGAPQLEAVFQRGEKIRVLVHKHRRNQHAMCIWSDHDFTIYPYRAGVPYHFVKIED